MGCGVCRGPFALSVVSAGLGTSFEQVEKTAVLEQELLSAKCQGALARGGV
jgi:hypothetical protein